MSNWNHMQNWHQLTQCTDVITKEFDCYSGYITITSFDIIGHHRGTRNCPFTWHHIDINLRQKSVNCYHSDITRYCCDTSTIMQIKWTLSHGVGCHLLSCRYHTLSVCHANLVSWQGLVPGIQSRRNYADRKPSLRLQGRLCRLYLTQARLAAALRRGRN
jgi:hypothetical protein